MQESTLQTLRREAIPLSGAGDIGAAFDLMSAARIVLLGEATHGTHEFYHARTELTKKLIAEMGFAAVAVEADWPDALHVHRHIRPHLPVTGPDSRAEADGAKALSCFQRFPKWMWRNSEILELVRWLSRYNQVQQTAQAGFFGIDLYSLRRSMEAVVRYLEHADPEAARRARTRYACFDHFGRDPQQYGYAVNYALRADCEQEAVQQLAALLSEPLRGGKADRAAAQAEAFYAQQNARVVQNAESYYRTMFRGRSESWNVRDTHMADTLDALCQHLSEQRGERAKLVVWAHNSHIGDARATEMGQHGQINIGQLMRERHGKEVFLLGFTTHAGTVTAASDWDSPAEVKAVRPSLENSYERLFHDMGMARFLLPIRNRYAVSQALAQGRLERAIGVVYLPESERHSHYFYADMARQFDAVIHFDETRAVKPLDSSAEAAPGELPETYPSGI